MIKKSITILISLFLLSACSPKIITHLGDMIYDELDSDTMIHIFNGYEKIPKNSVYVGKIKIGDTGFTSNCNYIDVLEKAKETALKTGANIIIIKKVKKPNFWSNCYRIKVQLYRNFDEDVLRKLAAKI